MALGYGGNPYGPAGTGKTESVKALGQAMARQARGTLLVAGLMLLLLSCVHRAVLICQSWPACLALLECWYLLVIYSRCTVQCSIGIQADATLPA